MADQKKINVSEVADEYYEGKGKKGSYQENTGGGHPFKAGDSNTRTTGANGKIRQAENDTDQPRTKDGKFTYNAVNGKDVKYEQRGKTVPPTLTGGRNGVYINEEDKKETAISAEAFFDKKEYQPFFEGDKVAFEGKVKTLKVDDFKVAQGYGEAKLRNGEYLDDAVEMFAPDLYAGRGKSSGNYSKTERKAAEYSKDENAYAVTNKEGKHEQDTRYLNKKAEEAKKVKEAKEEAEESSEATKEFEVKKVDFSDKNVSINDKIKYAKSLGDKFDVDDDTLDIMVNQYKDHIIESIPGTKNISFEEAEDMFFDEIGL